MRTLARPGRASGRAARLAASGAVLALAVSACTGTSSGHGSRSTAAAESKQCSTYDFDRANTLALKVTAALQSHSKPALLALFSDAGAKAKVSTWFDNLNAIGFTTGGAGVIGDTNSGYESTAPKTQSVQLAIGVHNAFDETVDADIGPEAPATRYTLNTNVIHDKDGTCHLEGTSWQPQNNAPWDSSEHLTVVHTAHTVVAGEPAVAADVRKVAKVAETAAAFDIGFYKSLHSSDDIRVRGFVLFVPKSAAENDAWFSYKNTPKPGGWIADVGRNAAGVEYPLYGPQIPSSFAKGAPRVAKISQIGGARAVITRTGLAASVHEQTATLVHEFTHYIYNNYNSGWFTGKSVDPALAEGAATYVETFYRANSNPNANNVHSMTLLAPALRPNFSKFKGTIPTQGEIYGKASLATYYYDLAATCFSYLASKYGIEFAFQSIRNAYANGGGPFSGIVGSNKGGTITFDDPAPYQGRWATWLRQQVH